MKLQNIFSISCGASVLMALYIGVAFLNLYRLMWPLAGMDLTAWPANDLVHPLWTSSTTKGLHMRVYLATTEQFDLSAFVGAEFPTKEAVAPADPPVSSKVALLWDQELTAEASLTKSFVLTTEECQGASDASKSECSSQSYQSAEAWLDSADQTDRDMEEGGLFQAMSNAGKGIESTSILLTIYNSMARQVGALAILVGLASPPTDDDLLASAPLLERKVVTLPPTSDIWSSLQSNSTLYIHVLLLRSADKSPIQWPPTTHEMATGSLRKAHRSHALLTGQVDMVKYQPPHHIDKPKRILYHDLTYLYNKHIMGSNASPPWDFAYSQPEAYQNYETVQTIKAQGAGYPYWKPQVAIKLVTDDTAYPTNMARVSGMQMVRAKPSAEHPSGLAYVPVLHVDEIGLTSEKYIPMNETVTALPLRISFDRSDGAFEQQDAKTKKRKTATAGGLSPARWRLLTHLSEAIEGQKELGFEQSDIDDVRRIIADTNVTLLAITLLASALHMLFEFLTFKSEVSFWRENKDLTGLSVRALFLDFFGQTVILLFLIEKDSSLLMTIPAGFGCLIALWKCHRAAGWKILRRTDASKPLAWYNYPLSLIGFEIVATRLLEPSKDKPLDHKDRLRALTHESDRLATKTLGSVLLPLVLGYTLYSLVYEEHAGWYSWFITSASSAVYALGFVLMTPQLFLNYKLKSVAHLPWRVLVYKSLNTFIDDLFSFIIRMPTMARISCFRDDVVFFIYLYQRWLYPVDASRPVEGGGGPLEDGDDDKTTETTTTETKKNQ